MSEGIASVANRNKYWASGEATKFWTLNKLKAPSNVFILADSKTYQVNGPLSSNAKLPMYRHGLQSFNMLFLDGHAATRNRPFDALWDKPPFSDL